MNKEHYWFWLCNIPNIGRKTIAALLLEYQTPQCIYKENPQRLKDKLGKGAYANFIKSKDEQIIITNYEMLAKKRIRFISSEADEYPESLCNILDYPYGIYVKGRPLPKNCLAIAIVGARQASAYGKEIARYFASCLAKEGIVVISGLAYGIDAQAHLGALDTDGYTVAVLGTGINIHYPKENYKIFHAIEQNGTLLSEYGPDTPGIPGMFCARNRLISGLARGVLVIEAGRKSGAFITVDSGLEQGKDIFSVPGRIGDTLSEGCNNLIKMGYALFLGPKNNRRLLVTGFSVICVVNLALLLIMWA